MFYDNSVYQLNAPLQTQKRQKFLNGLSRFNFYLLTIYEITGKLLKLSVPCFILSKIEVIIVKLTTFF